MPRSEIECVIRMKNRTDSIYLDLKQLRRFASLNHNIYIVSDPTPVDVDHDAHAWATAIIYSANHDDPPTLTEKLIYFCHVYIKDTIII